VNGGNRRHRSFLGAEDRGHASISGFAKTSRWPSITGRRRTWYSAIVSSTSSTVVGADGHRFPIGQ
jgi:hypothetical protein